MTGRLSKIPKNWLDLESCKTIYEAFRASDIFLEELPPFQQRLPGKLESILGSIRQSYDGQFLYPSILLASAGYLLKIIREHPFYNGNKRMAILFTDLFLHLNGIELKIPYQDLYNLATLIADNSAKQQYSEQELQKICRHLISNYSFENNIFLQAKRELVKIFIKLPRLSFRRRRT